jgi:Mrp family chromosome partitioning ATPase/capsular polysaccharide biosynthesis protein
VSVTNEVKDPRDLRDYLMPVLKRWWLILAVVPIATVGTYLYYDAKPKVYGASTQLYAQPSAVNQVLLGGSSAANIEATFANLSVFIGTQVVGEQAQRLLAKHKRSRPIGSVSAAPLEGTTFLAIEALAPKPGDAALLANTYAQAFIKVQARQLRQEAKRTLAIAERQLATLPPPTRFGTDPQREALEEKIQALELVSSQNAGNTGIKVVERAFPSATPIGHNPKSNAIFAFVISLMLAIGAAYGLEYLTRKIRSVEDAENIFDLPILTEVPKVRAPSPYGTEGAAMEKELHEPFHRLQMNLDMLGQERPLRTILVVSAAPGEGKSVVTRNLGLAYREAGRNVAVLDADFRKRTLGGLLDAQEGPGLTDIIAGRASFGEAVQEVNVPVAPNGNGNGAEGAVVQPATGTSRQPGQGDLAMIPAGRAHGSLAATLSTGGLSEALESATKIYDRVLIDSAPVLASADVLPLLSKVDGVLIVTRVGVSTRDSAKRMLAELRRIPDINIVGVAVNGIPPRTYRTRAYGYYYG